MERCGAVVKRRTRDREVPGSIPTNCKCCFLEQETLSTLLSTGFYPGKKRATWKISIKLLNVLPSINKVDYYYYYYYKIWWKLARWFLKNHDFIHVNSTVAGKYNKYKQDDGHLRFPIRTIFGQMSIYLPSPMAYAKIQPQGILGSGEEDF